MVQSVTAVTGAEDREQVLASVRRRPAELHLAVCDDVQPVAGVALAEQDVAPADPHLSQ
jgi:hypothetical protein